MKLDEDQILIQEVLNGKKQAFEELMKKYSKKIFNYTVRFVYNSEIAAELTQDFFIKIYHLLPRYNFQYKFTTWSYRILHNLIIDYLRKNSVKIDSLDSTDISFKAAQEGQSITPDTAAANLEKDEFKKELWQLVEKLPPAHRELIYLRYIQELKYEEIAEVLDQPIGTIKNKLFKIRELLKGELIKNGLLY